MEEVQMGIKVSNQWAVRLPVAETDSGLRAGLEQLGATPSGPLGHVEGKTKTSLMKNRNPARITAEISEHPSGALVEVTADALGNKHQEILDELVASLGEGLAKRLDGPAGAEGEDDRGISEAVEKLGRYSRMMGRREIAHLRNVLNPEERVVALAQGTYERLSSLIVLTDQRLIFLEKGILRESVKEFQLNAVSSMSLSKGWKGEALEFTVSGTKGSITQMLVGQGETLAAAYRQLRNASARSAAPAVPAPAGPDVLGQLEQLGKLRDAGVLTETEFESKKSELLDRL